MKHEPMLRVQLKRFKEKNGYENFKDNEVFERFVNDVIITMHQPEATSKNLSFLNYASVGGGDDTGIDGIAIKVGDFFVSSIAEIESALERNKKINFSFIFIQSKNKGTLDSGEFSKFADGICDFLSDIHHEPHNEKIDNLLELKNYLMSDRVMLRWDNTPNVYVYYALSSEWHEDNHFNAKIENLKDRIGKLDNYDDVEVQCYGAKELVNICNQNNNSFSAVLNVLGSLEFEEVDKVMNSQVIMCRTTELLTMLVTEEKLLRKSLFNDNVRDFQGNTEINKEMLETIKCNPSHFLLKNNGITIVCSKLVSGNRKVTMDNPQIVNGCQTSSTLYNAYKKGISLDNVLILVKIISTEERNITNSIVKGTNSQNPVYPETFEITRDFHKNFENFVDSFQNDKELAEKIFYERRSKQFDDQFNVKKYQIFGLDVLAHSVISCFCQSPHDNVLHVSRILDKFKNSIFLDSQSFYPYYVSAYAYLRFESLISRGKLESKNDMYKSFILTIMVEQIVGRPVSLDSNKIDDTCKVIYDQLGDDEKLVGFVTKAIETFNKARSKWIEKMGKTHEHGIKDNSEFTVFLLTFLRGGDIDKLDLKEINHPIRYGKVLMTKKDRTNQYFGFIEAEPDNVFFHSEDNPQIACSSIVGKTVSYIEIQSPHNGKTKAIKLKVFNNPN